MKYSNIITWCDASVEALNKVLGRKCKAAYAHAGYVNTGDLKKAVEEDIEVIVPSHKQALHKLQLLSTCFNVSRMRRYSE